MRLCVKYYYRKNIERMSIDEDCALFFRPALNRSHLVTGLLVCRTIELADINGSPTNCRNQINQRNDRLGPRTQCK